MQDLTTLHALFNLGYDPLESIPLTSAHSIADVEMLAPDGSWQKTAFENNHLVTPLLPAEPKVFRIGVHVPAPVH